MENNRKRDHAMAGLEEAATRVPNALQYVLDGFCSKDLIAMTINCKPGPLKKAITNCATWLTGDGAVVVRDSGVVGVEAGAGVGQYMFGALLPRLR